MMDLFKTKAEAVSSEVPHFSGKDAALSFIIGFL